MVFISVDELIPVGYSSSEKEDGKGHPAILGIILGMMVMTASLLMLK